MGAFKNTNGSAAAITSTRRHFLASTATLPWLAAAATDGYQARTSPMRSPRSQTMLDGTADVAIIGGSFAGLAAAYQLARASRTVVIYDTGEPRNRFADAVHGVLGHDGVSPEALRQAARQQLAAYPTVQFIDQAVVGIEQRGHQFGVAAGDGATMDTRRLILSYGLRDILPDRPGFWEGWGRSVLQCPYCHGYEVRQQRFALLYTSEASLHQIRIMPDWSRDVVFLADGHAIPQSAIDEMHALGVRFEPRRIRALVMSGSQLRAIIFEDGESLERDALFLITRNEPTTDLAQSLGCAMEEGPFGSHIATDNLKETTVPGVFAAGDVARAIHNLTWATSDGVTAGIFTHQSLLVDRNPYHRG